MNLVESPICGFSLLKINSLNRYFTSDLKWKSFNQRYSPIFFYSKIFIVSQKSFSTFRQKNCSRHSFWIDIFLEKNQKLKLQVRLPSTDWSSVNDYFYKIIIFLQKISKYKLQIFHD